MSHPFKYNLSTGSLLNTKERTVDVHYPSNSIVKNNGEVVIWLSAKKTDTSKVNWLPLPKDNSGNIYLLFRIYGAKETVVWQKCDESRLGKSFNKLQLMPPDYNLPRARVVKEH